MIEYTMNKRKKERAKERKRRVGKGSKLQKQCFALEAVLETINKFMCNASCKTAWSGREQLINLSLIYGDGTTMWRERDIRDGTLEIS